MGAVLKMSGNRVTTFGQDAYMDIRWSPLVCEEFIRGKFSNTRSEGKSKAVPLYSR